MNDVIENLQSVFDRTFDEIDRAREAFSPQLTPREVGAITSVSTWPTTFSSSAKLLSRSCSSSG